MRKLTSALVLGGCLLALPAVGDENATLAKLFGAKSSQPIAMSCPPPPQICDDGPGCTPSFDDCDREITGVNFVRQKPNWVCVYQCTYTDTCYDSVCDEPFPTVTSGGYRVRTEPILPPASCPAPSLEMCTTLNIEVE